MCDADKRPWYYSHFRNDDRSPCVQHGHQPSGQYVTTMNALTNDVTHPAVVAELWNVTPNVYEAALAPENRQVTSAVA